MIKEKKYINKNGLYLSESDNEHPFFVNPFEYIYSNIKASPDTLSPVVVTNYLQNSLREILYIFLNYPVSINKLSYMPGIVKRYYRQKSLNLLCLVEFVNNVNGSFRNFLNYLYQLDKGSTKLDLYFIASLVSAFYKDFAEIPKEAFIVGEKKKQECPYFEVHNFPEIEKDRNYLAPLKLLQTYGVKHLSAYVSGFYLHGSFSTHDYVKNWSDVDTLLIIKKETMASPRRIIELQKLTYKASGLFYSIDPFQSHGFFIISENDLEYYPQTYFPVMLFHYCRSFFKKDYAFKFKLRNSHQENMQIFWRDCLHYARNMLLKKSDNEKLSNNDIRMLLHRIYMFPVLYLQALGKHCYKKHSFDLARKDFSNDEWQPVIIANRVWNEWKWNYGYRAIPSSILSFSPFLTGLLLKKFYSFNSVIYRKYSVDYENLLIISVQLFESAWQKLLDSN